MITSSEISAYDPVRKDSVWRPNMDEWNAITSRDAIQRFALLVLICLAILALIALAVWYIA